MALALALAAPALAACHKGDSAKPRPPARSTSTTAVPQVTVTAASVAVESMKADVAKLPDDVRDGVVATLNAWVGTGVVAPLLTGQPPVGLDAVFTPAALARLVPGSPDRASLLEDTRPGEGVVQPEKAAVSLTGLVGEKGDVGLVTAGLDVSVVFVSAAGGSLRIARTGEVVLVPMPGGWRIDSYDVGTARDTLPPPPATTTTGKKKK
ncbi:MAG: hypothetical protein QOK43_2630 [Acidimicrobiaceae bacterium]|nr:hypothetical protein [Acidimicrobiaceae bacterium]